MKKARWLPAGALLLIPCTLSASELPTQIAPVIVTATRTAQTADETLASVTVFTREDIEARQARSVQDLLQGVPGLAISNNGGPGKATSLFLRGTNSDHLLVLIDGVKVGSATLGTTEFQLIPIDQIERVEIVRGPRSSLYGSEAIGGVIQIFTRKGGGPLRRVFSLGGGRYHTYESLIGFSGGGERGWFNLTASGNGTQGFNACNGEPGVGGCFTLEPDKDSYRSLSGALQAGYRFENGVEVGLHALRTQGDSEFDGDFQNQTDFVQQVLGGKLRFSPLAFWEMSLQAGHSRDDSDNLKDGLFQTRFETERNTATWQNDVALGTNHLLTAGLDYQDDRIDSSEAFTVTSRDSGGLFGQYRGNWGAHDLLGSLRYDDNQQFGGHTTGNAAWGYRFGQGLRLVASYGTAFKAPTFNQLYFPGFGNPNLGPEESESFEAGLQGTLAGSQWSLYLYETRIDELIAFDAATFAPANVDKARIRGLEATGAARFIGWDLEASLTLLDPQNRSDGPAHGNVLPRRAEQALRLDLARGLGRYRVGGTLFAEGRRFDDLANTQRLSSYATVDLRGEYSLTPHWNLQARLANVLDQQYETAAFYNQPGRSLMVTLRYQP
jgi:vitamin B12 transporter